MIIQRLFKIELSLISTYGTLAEIFDLARNVPERPTHRHPPCTLSGIDEKNQEYTFSSILEEVRSYFFFLCAQSGVS